jgi:hypothetical protein
MFTIFLVWILASISYCSGDTCYCRCCVGNFCTPTLLGTLTIPTCDTSACNSACQSAYPTSCTDGSGSTNYQCASDGGQKPNWVGVFEMANTCDKTTCCCATGQLIISQVNANNLRIQTQFSGQCPPGASSLDQTVEAPSGFTGAVAFLGNPIQITLSPDSRTILFNNPLFPSCTVSATRTGPASTATTNLPFVLLFIVGLTILELLAM